MAQADKYTCVSIFYQVESEITLHDGNLNFQVQTLEAQFTLAVTLVHLNGSDHNVDHHPHRRAAEDSADDEVKKSS